MGFGLLLFWFVCGVFAASIAQTKNYNGCLWLIIGVMSGPLAMIGIGFMEKRPAPVPPEPPAPAMRPCPFCAEPIRPEATKCRHCGSAVEPESEYVKRMRAAGFPVRKS
jgi:hypothetical protein